MAKAQQSLPSARLLFEAGDLDGSVNRSYYACYDASRAILETVIGLNTSELKTHSGLIRTFNLKVVKSGLMPVELGRLIGREEQLRLFADYGDGVHHPEDAKLAIGQAEAFVTACMDLLNDVPAP